MAFGIPEREFLRVAATSKPDWATLRLIATTALQYGPLRNMALLHQLDGVIASRLVDDRMGGTVPEIVQASCSLHLEHLAWVNARPWAEMQAFCSELDRRGKAFVVYGGPGQYAPLGLEHWPRAWDEYDVDAGLMDDAEVDALAADVGATVDSNRWPRWRRLHMPGGTEIDLGSVTPSGVHEHLLSWDAFSLPPRPVELPWGEVIAPHPVIYALRFCLLTCYGVLDAARRLPLWGLARLAVWTREPDWSWDSFLGFVQANPEASSALAWPMRLANAVYSFIPKEIVEQLPSGLPTVWSVGQVTSRPADYTAQEYVWHWPGEEAVLFNHETCEGLEARVEAGLWERYGSRTLQCKEVDGKAIFEEKAA